MITVKPCECIIGDFIVPPDKSISHRTVLFGAIADGKSHVSNFLFSKDCLSTVHCIQKLGIDVKKDGEDGLVIYGKGLDGLKEPSNVLNAGNSGTTMRLLSGLLASNSFYSVITGDASLRRRPMRRVINPLAEMGAVILARDNNSYPPLAISGRQLKGIKYMLPVPSAQVKSCIILAALRAGGETVIDEPVVTRDHTERMLKALGADITRGEERIVIRPDFELSPFETRVPGDISSASFIMTAAALLPGSKVAIRDVGLNPTRTGFIDVLRRMGSRINVVEKGITDVGEPYGDIEMEWAPLKGTTIGFQEIPSFIDEIPLIAVLGAKADGLTRVRGATELRVKESDRISSVVKNISAMGVHIKEKEDGFIVRGGQNFTDGEVDPCGDHRIAMTFAVAALAAKKETRIKDHKVVDISYPGFWDLPFFNIGG